MIPYPKWTALYLQVSRYQEHLPWALNTVNLQTKAGEKVSRVPLESCNTAALQVGIVGRTGSGKSSIFHCLFRLTEVSAGEVRPGSRAGLGCEVCLQVYIDNVNIRMLDLEELREQLIIIPQVLWSIPSLTVVLLAFPRSSYSILLDYLAAQPNHLSLQKDLAPTQDPFLFTGTVRENLDPVGFCSDQKLLEAVKNAR